MLYRKSVFQNTNRPPISAGVRPLRPSDNYHSLRFGYDVPQLTPQKHAGQAITIGGGRSALEFCF